MSYTLINNGDTGASVRTTLNALLTDVNNGIVGATGPAGTNGTSGSSGSSGQSGSSGSSGQTGSSGSSGQNGSSGSSGQSGSSGSSGISGSSGSSGTSGAPGATGSADSRFFAFGDNYLAFDNPYYNQTTANEWVNEMKNINFGQTFSVETINISGSNPAALEPSVRQNGNIIGFNVGNKRIINEINPFTGLLVATYSNPVPTSTGGALINTFDDKIITVPYNNSNELQIIGIIDPVNNTGTTYSLGFSTSYGYKGLVQRSRTSIVIQGYQNQDYIDFNPISLTHSRITGGQWPSGMCLAPNGNIYQSPNRGTASVVYLTPSNQIVIGGSNLGPGDYKFGTPVYSIQTDRIYCARYGWATASFLRIDPNTNTSDFITPTGATLPTGNWSSKQDIFGNLIFMSNADSNVYKYVPSTNVLSVISGGSNNYGHGCLAGDGRVWYYTSGSSMRAIGAKFNYLLDKKVFMSRMLSLASGSTD